MIIHAKCREKQWESSIRNHGWQSFLGSRIGGVEHSDTDTDTFVSIKMRGKGKKGGERGEGKEGREGGLGRKDEVWARAGLQR